MSSAELLTSYGELAEVIENLPLIVREYRRQRRLSLRAAAIESGVSAATLSRLENCHGGTDANSFAAILRWLDGPESNAESPSPGSAATEASGGAGEAQEG